MIRAEAEVEVEEIEAHQSEVHEAEDLSDEDAAQLPPEFYLDAGHSFTPRGLIESLPGHPPVPDRLVDVPEVARILGICERKAWHVIKTDPRFPRRRPVIKRTRFLLSDVIAYARSLGEGTDGGATT